MAPTSPHSWDNLPNEVLYMILGYISDFHTLSKVVSASSAARRLFAVRHREIFGSVLAEGPDQFSKLAMTTIVMRRVETRRPWQIHANVIRQLLHSTMKNNDSSRIKVPVLQDPTAALKEMAWLHQDTLYFTNAFIRSRCRPPKDSNGLNASAPITEAPVSPTELYRLQRALWRFWLVWAIVYRTPSIPQLWRRDTRGVAGDFVGRFTKWEIEELECVYYFLQDFYASSTGAIETPLPPDPERREKKRRIALQEFNKRRRAHRSLDMTAYPNEVEVSISISDPEGDEHKNSSSPFIHTQPNAIQRLLSATGYNTHAHCPLRLDKDKHIQAVLAILRRPVDRQFRQRDSINWMDAPTEANSANEGWKTYQRNAVYAIWEDYVNFDPNSLYPAASEWGRKPLMRFHGWGWCIWDQERLKRWGMLDEEGTVDVKRWYQGGVHGADDGEDAWESYWISLDKRLLHIPRCS